MGTLSIGGLVGLYGGAIAGILAWWFGRWQAKKSRGLDEVYQNIWQKTRSYSWYVTLFAIYLLFSLHLFGFEMRVAMVLGVLLLIHLASWAVIGVVLSVAMYSEEPIQLNRMFFGSSLIIVAVIISTILMIIVKTWYVLWIGLPISLLGLLIIIIDRKKLSA